MVKLSNLLVTLKVFKESTGKLFMYHNKQVLLNSNITS